MAEILKSAALPPYNQTIKTANHEHELTIGRLHSEASWNRTIQVRIRRDTRDLFPLRTIHRLSSVS